MASDAGKSSSDGPRHRGGPSPIEPLSWLIAATSVFLTSMAFSGNDEIKIFILGVLMTSMGARIFLGHGGHRITALGLFALSCSLVVGVGAIQEVVSPRHRTEDIYLEIAIYFSFVALCLISYITWITCQRAGDSSTFAPWLEPRYARTVEFVSCGLLAVLIATVLWEPKLRQDLQSPAFAVVALIAVGVFTKRGHPPRVPEFLLVGASLAIYAQLFQGGTGRLRLVALAFTVLVIWTATLPSRYLKGSLLALTPLGLIVLAHQRLSLQESLQEGASAGRTGLESMTEPIIVFARVVQAQSESGWPLAGGRTLFTLPLSVFRTSPDVGGYAEPLGYELVRITDPSRYGTGYSVAATAFGEWWYNFAAVSLVLLVPVLVIFLRYLDQLFLRTTTHLGFLRAGALKFALLAMACGSIGDLAWMGVHIYGARMLWRIPTTVLVLLLAHLIAGIRPPAPAPSLNLGAQPELVGGQVCRGV